MVKTTGELLPLPPVSVEPPANPDPPVEPLAGPAAQPEAANQLISRFWCILLVLSFSYQFYHALRVFLQRLGYLVFLQVLLLPCLAYSTFHVSLGHNFGFSFASLCYCCSYTYFILVGSFLFWLVCVPFGSGRRFCLEGNIFVCVCGPGPLVSGSQFCFGKNSLGYTVQDLSALGPGFLFKTKY